MSRDVTLHIWADNDPIIRQLRQLHHELNRISEPTSVRHLAEHVRRYWRTRTKHGRTIRHLTAGPRPAVGWRHRKGQTRR